MALTRRQFVAGSTAAAAGSFSSCARPEKAEPRSWNDALGVIEPRLPVLMAELKVPGVAFAAIRKARTEVVRNFGLSNAATAKPVDDDTAFEAQSMSKPVFAYRVMKLRERGVLDLDTPLTKYTRRVFVPGDSRLELITARRVLSHTTGLPNWRSKEQPLRFEFTPGERWKYSGEGYHYLQSVVTELTGHTDDSMCQAFEDGYRACATDFNERMTENLLKPFGMGASTYSSEAAEAHMATGHDPNGQPINKPKLTAAGVARYGSAGALLTTARDYAKFLIEVMEPKPADEYRLNAASLAEMTRPLVDVPGPVKTAWGLGWQIWHLPQGNLIAHGGDDTGFHSEAMFSPVTKSGFVILSNGENGYKLITERLLTDLIGLCFAS